MGNFGGASLGVGLPDAPKGGRIVRWGGSKRNAMRRA